MHYSYPSLARIFNTPLPFSSVVVSCIHVHTWCCTNAANRRHTLLSAHHDHIAVSKSLSVDTSIVSMYVEWWQYGHIVGEWVRLQNHRGHAPSLATSD